MPMRLSGLASGLDTDALVKSMMQPYKMRVDKMRQGSQYVQWQQEAYRNVIKGVNDITKKYFDVLNGNSYLLSPKLFSSLKPSGIPDTSNIKITTGPNAVAGNYSVKVSQLAKKAEVIGSNPINIRTLNEGNYGIKIDASNNKIIINDKEIILEKEKYNNVTEIATELNGKINADGSILKDKVKAVVKDGSINIETLFKIDENNKELKITVGEEEYTAELVTGNFTLEELTNTINNKLKTAKDINGKLLPSIEGVKSKLSTDGKRIEFENATSGTDYFVVDATLGGAAETDTGTDITISGKSISYAKEIIKDFNDTFNVKIGTNTSKVVKLSQGIISTTDNLRDKLNAALNAASVDTILNASVKEGKVVLSSNSNEQVIMTGETGKSAMSILGLSERYEMSMSTSEKMSNIIGEEVKFSINGVEFNYDFGKDYAAETAPTGAKNKSISQILADISEKAKVEISYSEINKKFTIRSRGEGVSEQLTANDSQGIFLGTLFGSNAFEDESGNPIKGRDAQVELTTPNGMSIITKSSNNFTIDGVNYNIAGAKEGEEINFSLAGNSEDSFNKIKEFIDDYNKLIDDVQKKLSEKKYRDFQPLTEEQKKDMSEDEIKKWEEKSKSGLLKSDSSIQNMLFSIRRAFFDPVEGAGLSLKEIGLTTSMDYNEGGKIVFDYSMDKDGNTGEERLKKLLKEDPNKVYKIFSQQSTSYSSYSPDLTSDQRKTRNEEQGILQRINDIFKDYTRTSKDSGGRRGIFVEKAGVVGTTSEIDNVLYKSLEAREKAIKDMERKLVERENKYYFQFAQLEKYMNQMNSQSAWLAQQLGGGA